ncbi:transporter [Methylocaldum sp. MU1018]
MIKKSKIFICGVFFLALANGSVSHARTKSAAEDTVPRSEYEKLKQEVESLKSQVQFLMNNEAWVQKSLGQPQAQKPEEAAASAPEQKEEKKAAAASAPEQKEGEKTTTAQAETPSPAPRKPLTEMGLQEGNREKEAEEAKRELDQFLRSQKVLFKKGDLQVEFSATYAHDTVEISPYKLKFKTAGAGVLFRYGLIDDLELDLSVPFTFAERELDPSTAVEPPPPGYTRGFIRGDGSGLGDVSGSLRWGALHEEGFIPETTLSLNVKSDTGHENLFLGTGFWNIGGTVSLVKTIDPVVFFGSLGYNAVLEKGGYDPGDQVLYAFGMGFSLNDRVSFSTSLNGAAVGRTKQKGFGEITGSGRDIDSLNFSVTVQVTKGLYLEPFVNFGLTEEATDFFAGINVPYRFDGQYPLPFFR